MAAITWTADGVGKLYQVQPLAVTTGVQPQFNIGDLDVNVF